MYLHPRAPRVGDKSGDVARLDPSLFKAEYLDGTYISPTWIPPGVLVGRIATKKTKRYTAPPIVLQLPIGNGKSRTIDGID